MRTPAIIGAAVVLVLALIGVWAMTSEPAGERAAAPDLVLVDDPSRLSEYVEVSRLGILTSENYVGHRIRVIEGSVVNLSAETLRSVRLHLRFGSFDGSAALESEEEALTRALPPGETGHFSFRFENLPTGWNYRVPEARVLAVGY